MEEILKTGYPKYENLNKVGAVLMWAAVLFLLTIPQGGPAAEENLKGETGDCPLSDNTYTVRIASAEINGRVGDPIHIPLELNPYPPPAGFFYTTVVDVMENPGDSAPEVLPGDRDITVWCKAPGRYRLRIRVNLIAKSSCGGAKASIIDEQEVSLQVSG